MLSDLESSLLRKIIREKSHFLTLTGEISNCNKMLSFVADILFTMTIAFVRIAKWIELAILTLFLHRVENMIKSRWEQIGVVSHTSSETFANWTKEDDQRILAKCPYNRVLHMRVHNPLWFAKLVCDNTWAMGQGYMDTEIEPLGPVEDITEMFSRSARSDFYAKYGLHIWNRFLYYLEYSLFNRQKRNNVWEVGKVHYDVGNDVFGAFLDPWMQYSNAYWARADNLNDAQLHKLELIAKKLQLKPGMRVLDIGSGWGTLCKYLAEKHGVECVGLTISKEGAAFSRNVCKGLPVEFRLQDYREVNEKFDRVVSVGMFEHVGHYNQKDFFKTAYRCLPDDGILLLHTIGYNHSSRKMPRMEPWIQKYIYPNGNMPYMWEIVKNTEDLFVVEDWHNFGADYEKTLTAWKENFTKNRESIVEKRGEVFYRMWIAFFVGAAGIFRARRFQLWQIVLTKDGLLGGYRAPR